MSEPTNQPNGSYIPEYVHFSNHLQLPSTELLSKLIVDPAYLQVACYKKLREAESENLVICPLLIELILIALRIGSEGETAEEIKRSLRHTDTDRQTIKRASKALLHQLMDNTIYYFSPASKIFVRSMDTVNINYKILSEGVFELHVELLNYRDPKKATEKINNWIHFQTTSTVHNIVPPKLLTSSCKMVIANSVFFQAPWHVEIDREPTCKKMFHVAPDHNEQVEFMHTLSYFNFYESAKLKAKFLEINLIEEVGSLVIVLPNEHDGIAHLEDRLEEVLTVPYARFTRQEIRAEVPKYIISTTLDWKEPLQQLGIKKLFTENEAQISGIAGAGNLHVDHLIQKIVIRVIEEGIETSTLYLEQKEEPKAPPMAKSAKEFIADHPFLFYVTVRDVIVFIGRLVNPSRPDEVE